MSTRAIQVFYCYNTDPELLPTRAKGFGTVPLQCVWSTEVFLGLPDSTKKTAALSCHQSVLEHLVSSPGDGT